MTYCQKCGTQNDDTAMFCMKCGNTLAGAVAEQRERVSPTRRHMEDECFGLPNGGAIAGVILGAVLVLIGLFWFLGINFWNSFWYILIIIVGVLMVAGAIYRSRRK